MRFLGIILLLASAAFAQDQAEAARIAAGCGSNSVQFDVKTDKQQHPLATVDPNNAVVYMLGDEDGDNMPAIGIIPTRIVVDGNWVGANGHKSYFFFTLSPGTHRLCTERQSGRESQLKMSAARTVTVDPGKTYYLRTRTPDQPYSGEGVKISPIDPAEAELILPHFAYSTFTIKQPTTKQPAKHHIF